MTSRAPLSSRAGVPALDELRQLVQQQGSTIAKILDTLGVMRANALLLEERIHRLEEEEEGDNGLA